MFINSKNNNGHFSDLLIKNYIFVDMQKYILIIFLLAIAILPSRYAYGTQSKSVNAQDKGTILMPSLPNTLINPKERANYLAVHFWDNFNPDDKSLINNENVTEQSFVNLISIFGIADMDSVQAGYKHLMKSAAPYADMLQYILSLGEKYFYEKESPYHDDKTFSHFLNGADFTRLDEPHRYYWERLLKLSSKNNIGTKASNFEWVNSDNTRDSLFQISKDYILLLFVDPDCDDCTKLKKEISQAALPTNCQIIAIYPGDDKELWEKDVKTANPNWINGYDDKSKVMDNDIYDLKKFPVIYLLDADKNVILKDTTFDAIKDFFNKPHW